MIINQKKSGSKATIRGKVEGLKSEAGASSGETSLLSQMENWRQALHTRCSPCQFLNGTKHWTKIFATLHQESCPAPWPAQRKLICLPSRHLPRGFNLIFFFQHFFREALNYQRDEIPVLFLFYRKGSGKSVPFSCHLQLTLGPHRQKFWITFCLTAGASKKEKGRKNVLRHPRIAGHPLGQAGRQPEAPYSQPAAHPSLPSPASSRSSWLSWSWWWESCCVLSPLMNQIILLLMMRGRGLNASLMVMMITIQ